MEPLGELTVSTHGRGELVSGSVAVAAKGPIGGVLRFDLPDIGVAGVGASPSPGGGNQHRGSDPQPGRGSDGGELPIDARGHRYPCLFWGTWENAPTLPVGSLLGAVIEPSFPAFAGAAAAATALSSGSALRSIGAPGHNNDRSRTPRHSRPGKTVDTVALRWSPSQPFRPTLLPEPRQTLAMMAERGPLLSGAHGKTAALAGLILTSSRGLRQDMARTEVQLNWSFQPFPLPIEKRPQRVSTSLRGESIHTFSCLQLKIFWTGIR